MTQRALIIGGGIGGLAAAIALRNAGKDVTVFERGPQGEVQAGFGMMLWPNGMRALKELGVADKVHAAGCDLYRVEIRSSKGVELNGWPVRELGRKIGSPAVSISRAVVHKVLADEVGSDLMSFDSWGTGISQDAASATVHLRDKPDEQGDFVIAADGIRSRARGAELGLHWPEFPPYAGYNIWHAVIDGTGVEGLPKGKFIQFLGQDARLVCTRIDDSRIYWSALGFVPQGGTDAQSPLATVRERYRGWGEPIQSLLDNTREEQVARREIFGGQPLPRWGSGRMTLLGDAAHPMTTVLGQGGCMALEDAAVLGRTMRGDGDSIASLRRYEEQRIARTRAMMALIHRFNPGKPESAIKVKIRNQAIKYAFSRGIARSYERLVLQPA